MLDKIILGLLQFSSHTSYSLQKSMEQSTSFFYGASQGSISPALKKLVAGRLIEGASKQDGRRKRIEYSITALGQQAFDDWVGSEFKVGRVRDDALVRLFFLGHLERDKRAEVVDQYCEDLREQKSALKGIIASIDENLAGRELTEVELYRLETLRYGIEYYDFSIQWFARIAKRDQTA